MRITCYMFFQLFGYSDGTHSLQRFHWWASNIAKYLQIILVKKQTHLHIWDGLSVSIYFYLFILGGGGVNYNYKIPRNYACTQRKQPDMLPQ